MVVLVVVVLLWVDVGVCVGGSDCGGGVVVVGKTRMGDVEEVDEGGGQEREGGTRCLLL